MDVQLSDDIINNLFVRKDKNKYVDTDGVVTICKLSKLYVVLGGENIVFKYLRSPTIPHFIVFLDLKVSLRDFIRIDEIAHGKSDN